ncbi:MAG: outer membrane lipoprotein-sorting protein [Ignavibacteria bacterium]|nr:MAG: outer membrane lipoprotein-sorting protein [Ignavibacteria bacterium]
MLSEILQIPTLPVTRQVPSGKSRYVGKRIYRILFVAVFLMLTTIANAQTGNEILAKVDSVMNAPKDMTAIEKMTLTDKDGSQKDRDTKIYQKGSEWRLVRFLTPADVKGVGFLRLASDRLYLYLPAFRKVRRIASSVKNENFMGTDFSYEDMSQSSYSNDYTAKLLKKENDQYILELTPKPNADVSYEKLILYVDQSNYVYRKIEYYNNGKQIKVLTVDNIEKIDNYWFGKKMEMRDLKKDHRTTLTLTEIKFDQGLSDKVFTERNLKRPE